VAWFDAYVELLIASFSEWVEISAVFFKFKGYGEEIRFQNT